VRLSALPRWYGKLSSGFADGGRTQRLTPNGYHRAAMRPPQHAGHWPSPAQPLYNFFGVRASSISKSLMGCLSALFSSFQKQVTGHPRHSPPFCSPAGALCAGGHCHSVQECSPAPPEYRVRSCSDSSSPPGDVWGDSGNDDVLWFEDSVWGNPRGWIAVQTVHQPAQVRAENKGLQMRSCADGV
jgi:hypothetical protein